MDDDRPPGPREVDGRIVVVAFVLLVVLTLVVLWARRHESGHDVHLVGASEPVTLVA